jgi:hypothetical protein
LLLPRDGSQKPVFNKLKLILYTDTRDIIHKNLTPHAAEKIGTVPPNTIAKMSPIDK